jgi:hypothetical protein
MMEFIKKITGNSTLVDQKKDDFSDFFLHADSKEKKSDQASYERSY